MTRADAVLTLVTWSISFPVLYGLVVLLERHEQRSTKSARGAGAVRRPARRATHRR